MFPGETPLQTIEQEIDFGAGGRRERCGRAALRIAGQHTASHHHVLAHRQAHAGLLLVAHQRQMRIEQIMGVVAPAVT